MDWFHHSAPPFLSGQAGPSVRASLRSRERPNGRGDTVALPAALQHHLQDKARVLPA